MNLTTEQTTGERGLSPAEQNSDTKLENIHLLFSWQRILFPAPRRLCFHLCPLVCVFVSRIIKKLLKVFPGNCDIFIHHSWDEDVFDYFTFSQGIKYPTWFEDWNLQYECLQFAQKQIKLNLQPTPMCVWADVKWPQPSSINRPSCEEQVQVQSLGRRVNTTLQLNTFICIFQKRTFWHLVCWASVQHAAVWMWWTETSCFPAAEREPGFISSEWRRLYRSCEWKATLCHRVETHESLFHW